MMGFIFFIVLGFFFLPSSWACNQYLLDVSDEILKFHKTNESILQKYFVGNIELNFEGKIHSMNKAEIFNYGQLVTVNKTKILEKDNSHPLFDELISIPEESVLDQKQVRNLILQHFWNYNLSRTRKMGSAFSFAGKGSLIGVSLRKSGKNITEAKDLLDEYLDFLKVRYKEKMGVTDDDFEILREISQRVEDRTELFIYAKNEVTFKDKNPNFPDQLFFHNKALEKNLDINAGFILVSSNRPEELLPLEILNNIKISRPLSPLSGKPAGIAEIGRLTSDTADQALEFAQLASMSLRSSDNNIQYVVIEVDIVRKRLFQRYGFKELETDLPTNEYYPSGTNYLMMANINDFLNQSHQF